ncbi:restriction endonuclease subunit S [Lacticaseibacillus paracasei]|uniref:restriction endonuclease subunit S n=1 Tax=Lacticaseibacillus paracasei TaxID=1597 RepID=UPI000FF197E5|nr:restriction endonuclease subunit S [Lacticaseibacillus paracasei]RNE41811.1 Type I restriction modification DNA specificity domain protein [Lacticaseibacillus paracasei]
MKDNQAKYPQLRFKGFTDPWEQRKLEKLVDVRSGHDYKHLNRGNIPVYGTGGYMLSVDKALSENEDAIGIGRKGTIDNPFLLKAPFWTVDTLFYVVPRVDYNLNFVNSIFQKINWKKYDESTGVPSLSKSTINSVIISFPSYEEQKQIGTFFQQLDKTIALHQRKLTKLKELKQGYLQKLFPRNGSKFPQLRFAGFADAWEERKLGELMDITSVKRIHQSDWTNNGIRFLRARDIVSAAKREEPSDYLYISEEKYEEYSKVSGKVQIGDLLVTGVGTIGVPMLVVHKDPLYFKDGNIIWFKNKSNIDGNFFYYSFIGMKIQKYIRDVAGIGTVGTYTIDSGKKTPISLPNNEEQQKIGSFFKQLDATIALHQRKLEKLQELKKGYLQKMFC